MAQSEFDRINGIWINHLQTKYNWEDTYGPIPPLETEPPSLKIFFPFQEIQKIDSDVFSDLFTFYHAIIQKFEETVYYKMHEFELFCIEQHPFFKAIQISKKGNIIVINDEIQEEIPAENYELNYAWSKIKEELNRINGMAPVAVISEFDAIFCINAHGCVMTGESEKGECIDDDCRYEILKPPDGKQLTFLTATPLGVVNISNTGSRNNQDLKDVQEFIYTEIRKGHLDIHKLQNYLRSTKIKHSLKLKDESDYQS